MVKSGSLFEGLTRPLSLSPYQHSDEVGTSEDCAVSSAQARMFCGGTAVPWWCCCCCLWLTSVYMRALIVYTRYATGGVVFFEFTLAKDSALCCFSGRSSRTSISDLPSSCYLWEVCILMPSPLMLSCSTASRHQHYEQQYHGCQR